MNASASLDFAALRQSLAALVSLGVVPKAVPELDRTIGTLGAELRDAVLGEVPAFAASANPEILPGLEQHTGDHIRELRRLFEGGDVGDFAFVAAQAHRRAEQRFPLEVTLHAYRCGHRVLSRWMRNAAVAAVPESAERTISAVADFAIEYTNTISSILASEYVAHTRMLAEAESDRRTELLNILLSGYDEADGRVAQLLKRAGYLEQRQAYCVILAQAANASEMDNPARVQRIVAAVADAMAGTSVRALVGVRNALVTAVLSDRRRQSGWTAPQSNLADRIASVLYTLGTSVLVGVSADHPSTAFIPKALHEATIALDFTGVDRRVVPFSALPVRDLLVHRGADYVQSAPPAWMVAFVEADAKAQGNFVATLRAIADADMNVQQAARKLGRHPNTVYARVERIRRITGLDCQKYDGLTEMLLAADCWRI